MCHSIDLVVDPTLSIVKRTVRLPDDGRDADSCFASAKYSARNGVVCRERPAERSAD
jgi:hypothetical protein